MIRKSFLIIFLILSIQFSHSQTIDRYGFNIGTSYSTQLWNHKMMAADFDYKFGLMTFLSAEKYFGRFGLRTEIGYIQKGFKDKMETFDIDGTSLKIERNNETLHNLAMNIGVKVHPIRLDNSPYVFVGVRSGYLISHAKNSWYKLIFDEFSKFNLGGLFGIGINFKELFYFEIEYNPSFTKSLDEKMLSIKDKCFGVKFGININKLIR